MFKFTFLGIEVGKDKCKSEKSYSKTQFNRVSGEREKMGKLTKQQKKFGRISNICHNKTNSNKSYGHCMHRELSK